MFYKQNTAALVRIGAARDATDGITPVTTLALGAADQAELLKASGGTVDISGNTFAAITDADGWFDLTLSSGNMDTLGPFTVVVQDASLMLPLEYRGFVLPGGIYDIFFGGSGTLSVNASTIVGVASDTAIAAIVDDRLAAAGLATAGDLAGLAGATELAAAQAILDLFVFSEAGSVDANVKRLNDVELLGDGSATKFTVS